MALKMHIKKMTTTITATIAYVDAGGGWWARQ